MLLMPGKVLAFSTLLLLVAGLALAQEAPLKTVEAILEGVVEANGGPENIQRIHSIRATGRVLQRDGSSFEILILRKKPGMKRVTRFQPNGLVHQGFDGETSWRQMILQGANGEQSEVVELEGEAKARFERDSKLLDLLFYPISDTISHVFEGVEYVGRVPCYVVTTLAGSTQRRSYVDSRTFRLPKVVDITTDAEGKPLEIEQLLSDYVKVEGIWVAREIVRVGVDGLRIEFDEVKINEGIFSAVFAMPAGD